MFLFQAKSIRRRRQCRMLAATSPSRRVMQRAMASDEEHTYLIALGSNVRHHRYGSPPKVLSAALREIERCGIELRQFAPTISSRPLGPSQRIYANSAAIVCSEQAPLTLLSTLQKIERQFGRERRGRRWRARILDLDIILWSGGAVEQSGLNIPHPSFRERDFVLGPASAIASNWRDPITNLTLRQLSFRQLSFRQRKAQKKEGDTAMVPPPSLMLVW